MTTKKFAPLDAKGRLCLSMYPDPTNEVRCNRLFGHDGDHSGYGHAMRPYDWYAIHETEDGAA